ncbi:hypothetical protein FOA43_000118 [Brettanomyces nanus]|uniref:Uncharacterized protein n=1 Tax=Eeniella nana TaxID=13502 RepID=A0A875RVY5_EENNA|nr:uncharacterized protein FOA43_000118 [Brettanomyces nanus]QPG72816.1 hypothetical protein FOA43_000118 [Brettanomyces nanus]
MTRSMSMGLEEKELLCRRAKLTPRQEKARILKMRLQLAYYKVKTNQADVPVHQLRLPGVGRKYNDVSFTPDTAPCSPNQPIHRKSKSQPKSLDALSDLLAASSPLFKRTNPVNATHRRPGRSGKHKMLKSINHSGKTRGKRLDDVVAARKSASSLMQRQQQQPLSMYGHIHAFSIDCTRSRPSYLQPLSAPPIASRMGLTLPTPFHHQSFSNQTSPSRFLISNTGRGIARTSIFPPSVPTTNSQDLDATIIQNTSSLILTPVRGTRAPKLGVAGSSDRYQSINQDEIQAQTKSPSRLQSTPSSIGAARCLLQLAHR